MSIKTPRLTRDRCGVYYFRLVVPLALRKDVGKTEYRRSLRTKDSAIARQRALVLSVAVETLVANPKISDFSHLFKEDSSVGKLMTIDFERGIFHADTPEEGRTMAEIVAKMVEARKAVHTQVTTVLPSSKCGTNLETAKDMFLKERTTTLKSATMNKHRGVLRAFIDATGNVDVAMVDTQVVNDYKQKQLETGRKATTINDQMSKSWSFRYCPDRCGEGAAGAGSLQRCGCYVGQCCGIDERQAGNSETFACNSSHGADSFRPSRISRPVASSTATS